METFARRSIFSGPTSSGNRPKVPAEAEGIKDAGGTHAPEKAVVFKILPVLDALVSKPPRTSLSHTDELKPGSRCGGAFSAGDEGREAAVRAGGER